MVKFGVTFIAISALVSAGFATVAQADVSSSATRVVQSTSESDSDVRVTRAKARGSLNVFVSLPRGQKAANITVTGPRGFKKTVVTKTTTLKNVPVGTYTIKTRATRDGKAVASTKATQKVKVTKSKKPTLVRVQYRSIVTSVRFTVKSAIGLANGKVRASSRSTRSGSQSMIAVRNDGSAISAIAEGKAQIRGFKVLRGRVFVAFHSWQVVDGGVVCQLAEISRSTGIPSCIDSGILHVDTTRNGVSGDWIQMDANGAVYYMATLKDFSRVMRRSSSGSATSLTPRGGDWNIDTFYVTPNGGVLMQGTTQPFNYWWIRYRSPEGRVDEVLDGGGSFLTMFSDGNVYFGGSGVRRILTSTSGVRLEDGFWCTSESHPNCGTSLKGHVALDGSDYVLVDSGDSLVSLARFFPSVAAVPTGLRSANLVTAQSPYLVVSGRDTNRQHALSIVDTRTTPSSYRIPAESLGIEIFGLEPGATSNEVLFTGLRFSDSAYVIGKVWLSQGTVRILSETGSKWEDFQTFGRE